MDAPPTKRLKPNKEEDAAHTSQVAPAILRPDERTDQASSQLKLSPNPTTVASTSQVSSSNKACASDSEDEMPQLINLSDPTYEPVQQKQQQQQQPKELTVLSWNIDGLDDRAIETRSYGVFEYIHKHSPDIVLLQEVVDKNLNIIESLCSSKYHINTHKVAPYYNAVMVKKCDHILMKKGKNFDFENTAMGRYLMIQKMIFNGVRFVVMTTHLESCAESSDLRKAQLRQCFDAMQEHRSTSNVIFSGDLNIREKEISALGGPPSGIKDSWVVCGCDKEKKFTWDCQLNDNKVFDGFKPRARYDRMFFSVPEDSGMNCKSFELVGKQKISSCGLFPSDHFGLLVKFSLND